MSNKLNVLLVGSGYMGREYAKVLRDQALNFSVVCRSEKSAKIFFEETGIKCLSGGLENAFLHLNSIPDFAIVAVSVQQLAETTIELLKKGVKRILVEKPAGMNRAEIESVNKISKIEGAKIYVAYNRRFYASTEKALEIVASDGGVSSVNFEFTEWAQVCENTSHPKEVKDSWLFTNSTHVIDLAFFFAGNPIELSAYHAGSLSWHRRASKYAGAGVTNKGVLFSYQANWDAPGRWAVEVLTRKHRIYFKPMEKLAVQSVGSMKVEEEAIEDILDVNYKPGLYRQCEVFFSEMDDSRLLSLEEHIEHIGTYEKIAGLV